MAEAKSEEAISLGAKRLRKKTSEMLKSPSSMVLPASNEQKSSSILTKSLAEMEDEDPIRLQNQSCVIREEIVKIRGAEQLVYSSLARLPTFSIGLSSTKGEDSSRAQLELISSSSRAQLRESIVDPKVKSPHRYFQMPELGARVFVGDSDGFDTVACQPFQGSYGASKFQFDLDNEAVTSLYKDDHPGGFIDRLRAQPEKVLGSIGYSNSIVLRGTKLFVCSPCEDKTIIEIVGGKSSRVSGSSSEYKDCTGDETITQPSDIVEQPGDLVCDVLYDNWPGYWIPVDRPYLYRSFKGSYLRKPKFLKRNFRLPKWDVMQLTKFDDFVIFIQSECYTMLPRRARDIVRENASKSADVIAAQLVKAAQEDDISICLPRRYPITAIVISLDRKEILGREQKKKKKGNMAKNYMAMFWEFLGAKGISHLEVLEDDKKISELKEEEKITLTRKEEEKMYISKMEDKKEIEIKGDHKFGMESVASNSNLTSGKVQDDSEASSSIVLFEDVDCQSKGFKVSCHMTKWIICKELVEKSLLCFFNIEKMQHEFYFEDHESMATIIGLGVPHSKVVLECGSPHVTIVEILEEDWDVVWTHSNDIPCSIPQGDVLKQERFPNILFCIANVINTNNTISKASNGGVGGDNGKDKAEDNGDDIKGKDKAHDHDNHRNDSHLDGGSNGPYDDSHSDGGANGPYDDDNDKKEREEKDGNDDKKDNRYQNNGKIPNDGKEVQVVVHLVLLPGGDLEEKEKKKELGKVHKEDEIEEENEKEGEGDVVEVEEKKKEGESQKGVGKKKKKHKGFCFSLKRRDLIGNQRKSTTIKGVGNGEVDVNLNGNHQKSTIIKAVENGNVDERLKKQLEDEIHSEMVFTFTIKDEDWGQLKSIQVSIDEIIFQLSSNNKENYLQGRRFVWFHDYLQVAFGVINAQTASLDSKSCKVLKCSEAKEVNLQGNAQENASTHTTEKRGDLGVQYFARAIGRYGTTKGSRAQTTKEFKNTWETNKTLTQGGFTISEDTNLTSSQLKYSYHPQYPFKEQEFVQEDGCLEMYKNHICKLQRVSCEGTWHPDCSETYMEAYKLEASRELRMTRIYNLEPKIGEEKKQKLVWKAEPLCFIQKLEKVLYLNHSMSHLTTPFGVYRLRERQDPSNSSTTILTQFQSKEGPKWPGNDPLVDVCT